MIRIHKIRKRVIRIYEVTGLAMLVERCRKPRHRNSVFIWIPKSAGTSVYEMLGAPPLLKTEHLIRSRFANKDLVTFGHVDYGQLLRENYVSSEFDRTAYKFAFCRNPYARMVSLYFYSQRVGRLSTEISFLEFCRQLADQSCEPIGLYNSEGLSQCNPQCCWLEGFDVDFVGRVESLQRDLAVVMGELGLDAKSEVPQLNSTSHRKHQDYYCRESRELVERLYADDFAAFGYHKDLDRTSSDGTGIGRKAA